MQEVIFLALDPTISVCLFSRQGMLIINSRWRGTAGPRFIVFPWILLSILIVVITINTLGMPTLFAAMLHLDRRLVWLVPEELDGSVDMQLSVLWRLTSDRGLRERGLVMISISKLFVLCLLILDFGVRVERLLYAWFCWVLQPSTAIFVPFSFWIFIFYYWFSMT